jgi:hypothetical protein
MSDATTQADIDLQRVFELFDTALTSKDERVVNALRSLLMIVALTDPEDADAKGDIGPLRAMERDLNSMHGRIRGLEDQMRAVQDVLSRADATSRRYGSDRAYIWPDRSDPNPLAQSSSNIYMNDYIKKLNGGSI